MGGRLSGASIVGPTSHGPSGTKGQGEVADVRSPARAMFPRPNLPRVRHRRPQRRAASVAFVPASSHHVMQSATSMAASWQAAVIATAPAAAATIVKTDLCKGMS